MRVTLDDREASRENGWTSYVLASVFDDSDGGRNIISIGLPYRGRINLADEDTSERFRQRALDAAFNRAESGLEWAVLERSSAKDVVVRAGLASREEAEAALANMSLQVCYGYRGDFGQTDDRLESRAERLRDDAGD